MKVGTEMAIKSQTGHSKGLKIDENGGKLKFNELRYLTGGIEIAYNCLLAFKYSYVPYHWPRIKLRLECKEHVPRVHGDGVGEVADLLASMYHAKGTLKWVVIQDSVTHSRGSCYNSLSPMAMSTSFLWSIPSIPFQSPFSSPTPHFPSWERTRS